MRPIHIVSDSTTESGALTVIDPPPVVAREGWGRPIVVAHYQEEHYEATEQVEILDVVNRRGHGGLPSTPVGGVDSPMGDGAGVEVPVTPHCRVSQQFVPPVETPHVHSPEIGRVTEDNKGLDGMLGGDGSTPTSGDDVDMLAQDFGADGTAGCASAPVLEDQRGAEVVPEEVCPVAEDNQGGVAPSVESAAPVGSFFERRNTDQRSVLFYGHCSTNKPGRTPKGSPLVLSNDA